jgi:hypothetical protein
MAEIATHFPALAENGLKKVRLLPRRESRRRRRENRWKRLGFAALLPVAGLFSLLLWLAVVSIVKEHLDYRWLVRHGTKAPGEVVKLERDDNDLTATLVFKDAAGDEVRTKRQVFGTFADKYRKGASVTMLYRLNRPQSVIVKGWDRAGREILMLIFLVLYQYSWVPA